MNIIVILQKIPEFLNSQFLNYPKIVLTLSW